MKKLWLLFGLLTLLSFGTLLWIGTEIFREAPPIPKQVVATDGTVLIDDDEISKGQNVWQALGGMQIGSIWGHGSYVAPDWTADYLHREAEFVLDDLSNKEYSQNYAALDLEKQALIKQRMKTLMRTNNYDAATGKLTIEPVRAKAFQQNLQHYSEIFTNGNKDYAIQKNAQSDPEKLRLMNSFFFWTAWASAANRPDNTISYTSNFPSEPLVDNVPTGSTIIWTGVSVIVLIAGLGGMIWFFVSTREEENLTEFPNVIR